MSDAEKKEKLFTMKPYLEAIAKTEEILNQHGVAVTEIKNIIGAYNDETKRYYFHVIVDLAIPIYPVD